MPPLEQVQYRFRLGHPGPLSPSTKIGFSLHQSRIDLAVEKHQVCVVNRTGKVVGELAFEHSGAGLIDFIHWLEELSGSLTTRIGIVLETPRGPVVECVLEHGYSVFSILQEQVLAAFCQMLGKKHPETLRAMSNLAQMLKAQDDLAGARNLQEQVLVAFRQLLGEEHPDTLAGMNNLAATRYAQGDLAGARQLQEQVLLAIRQ